MIKAIALKLMEYVRCNKGDPHPAGGFSRFVTAIVSALLLAPGVQQVATAGAWSCAEKPVEPCFVHHGRLSSQNGIARMIWLIGTKRLVRVDNAFDDDVPLLSKYLELTGPNHSVVYGDFAICPLEPERPGYMRSVCVTGAENLVVSVLSGARPPFRLRSTWSGNSASAAKTQR
jgi:hypothetical protein